MALPGRVRLGDGRDSGVAMGAKLSDPPGRLVVWVEEDALGDKQIAWFEAYVGECLAQIEDIEFERECRGWTFAADTASCAVGMVSSPELFGVRVMGAAANFERVTAKLVREVNSLNLHSPVKWLLDDDVVRAEMYLPADAVETDTLATAVGLVSSSAAEFGPLLAMTFDGETPYPSESRGIESD